MARGGISKYLIASAAIVAVMLIIGFWMRTHQHRDPARLARTQKPPADLILPPLTSRGRRAAANTPSNAVKADAIEICGVGRIPQNPDDPGANQYVGDLTRSAWLRWVAAVRDSDDYRARTAGIFVDTLLNDRHAEQRGTQDAHDELVAIAVGSSDPAV